MSKASKSVQERQNRRQARFDEIIDAAANRFAEHGFDATINEIARDLGITGAALYYYVESKEQLLYEIWQRAGAVLQNGLEEEIAASTPTLTKLRNTFRRHLHTIITNRAIFEILILQRSSMPQQGRKEFLEAERQYLHTLAELISEIPQEDLRIDEPRLLARSIIAMLNGVIRWYSDSYRLSLDEIADLHFDMITSGIIRHPHTEAEAPALSSQ